MANVIFDFDGTLVDSLKAVIDVLEEMVHKNGEITPAQVKSFREESILTIAENFNISKWRIPFLLIRGRRMMRKHINELSVFPGINSIIKKLHENNNHLYIMSSNSTSNIKKYLKQQLLLKYFDQVYGGVGILGKPNALRKLIKRNNLVPADTYYIGDEVRDIESSKQAGIKCIAVNWGFASAKSIKEHEPFAIASSADDILNLIQKDN